MRILLAQRLAFDPTIGGVAAGLGVSERTLRRRLASDGTSFQTLLDQVRSALARQLLDSGALGVEEVAHRLGYSDASSFITGSNADVAQLFVPHRSAIQILLPSRSMSTALIDPQVRPLGSFAQAHRRWHGTTPTGRSRA